MTWILIAGRLYLPGYAICIDRPNPSKDVSDFVVTSPWHGRSNRVSTLAYAKTLGETWAKEIDAFKDTK